MSNINILMSINKKFLEYSEEMIFSLLYYSSEKINLYLMYQETELNEDELESISRFVARTDKGKVFPIKIDANMLEGAPLTDNEGSFFGIEAYSRLFCSFKLPKEVNKILYLDADMICTGDIKELYNIEFEGKTWVAVQDKGIKEEDLKRLGLPANHEYINSGMLLINVEKLKENYTAQKIAELILKNREILIYPDQDFINKFFKGDIKLIDRKYNLLAKDIRYKDLAEKPLIIHYAGSMKPWGEDVSRFEEEYIEPYYEVLKLQKEYKREKLEKLLQIHKKCVYKN